MAKRGKAFAKSEETKLAILKAGIKMYPDVSARKIADEIEVTHPVIAYHFKDNLMDAIAEYAVENKIARVIAHLIVNKHKAAKKLTPKERKEYLSSAL